LFSLENLIISYFEKVIDNINDIISNKQNMTDLKTPIKQNMTDLKTPIKQNVTDLKTPIKQNVIDLKTPIKQNMTDLKTPIKQNNDIVPNQIDDTKTKLCNFCDFSNSHEDEKHYIKNYEVCNKFLRKYNHGLSKLLDKCKEYECDDKYVYKSCNNTYDHNKYFVVLEKITTNAENKGNEDIITITNETRKGVVCEKYAKFRANRLKVIRIFNFEDLTECNMITNEYSVFPSIKTIYYVKHIAECDEFTEDLDVVCGGGIHYFKSIIAAYFYNSLNTFGNFSGIWLQWHENGILKSKEQLLNNTLNGQCEIWNKKGIIKRTGQYLNGGKDGKFIDFNDVGVIIRETTYVKGFRNGPYKIYNMDTMESGQYVMDVRSGIWNRWSICRIESDQKLIIKEINNYQNDKLHGIQTKIYPNGEKCLEELYKHGKLIGILNQWHENSNKKMENKYNNQDKLNDTKIKDHDLAFVNEWYPDGKPKISGGYENGFRSGEWVIYDENGKKENTNYLSMFE
jgi:antitoxin component YwqK of YwqJK toxin-antitoxin module